MYQKTFSRGDLMQVVGFQLMFITASLFGFLLHPLAALGMYVFLTEMVPFVNDTTTKDSNAPPYFRCQGCGNLYSENDKHNWNDHEFCHGCIRDDTHQKRFALKIPMTLKRLRKL